MARKSERNKSQGAQAAPEKVAPERGRKSTRIPRRKKKSSSESEGEAESHVEKEKEVGEITEPKAGPPPETDSSQDGSVRSRRSTRRHPGVALEPEKEPEKDKPHEWKEDPTFWGAEEAAPEEKATKAEGTTWKIQSSNGSGGEIQKLKICRQRVSESGDASSPAAGSSPRRKKATRSNKNIDEGVDSGGDVGSSNETKSESRTDSIPEVKEELPTSNQSELESQSQLTEETQDKPPIAEPTVEPSEAGVGAQPAQRSDEEGESSEKLPQEKADSSGDQVMKQSAEVIETPVTCESSSRKLSTEEEGTLDSKSNKSLNKEHKITDKTRKPSVEEEKAPDNKSRKPSVEEDRMPDETSRKSSVDEEKIPDNKAIKSSVENDDIVDNKSRKSSDEEGTTPDSKSRKSSDDEDKAPDGKSKKSSVEEDKTLDNKSRKSPVEDNDILDDKSKKPLSKQDEMLEIKSRKSSTEDNEKSDNKPRKLSTEEHELKERKLSTEGHETKENKSGEPLIEENENSGRKSQNSTVEDNETSDNKARNSSSEDDPPKITGVPEEVAVVEENAVISDSKEESRISENNNNVEPRSRTKSETSDDGKGVKKVTTSTKVKVPVNSEVAMDEIAKKLNERAARFSRDSSDSREKKWDSTESKEPKSPREEGELTPVPEIRKSKHTTIVINKPREITSQPTRLKRNTDELPPTERKRRILSKTKPKDKEEDPINISSQSLMLLVPEVKTITPEQVASFPLDDDDLSKFQSELPVEPKLKKKIDLKPKDVEVRVQNDTRQVIKKKPIIIDTKDHSTDSKAVGPKLPAQENHRVVRKISLLSEDSKKPRRSPSPGGRSPTEVLFITNLVRPFTVPQLRELLARTGTIAPNGFYIDKIKSKCYVKYTDIEMAVETRHALNGVRWPVNNPKTLKVEFATAEDMAIVQKLADEEMVTKKAESSEPVGGAGWLSEQAALKPQRRVTAAVREWDMGKVGAGQVEEKRPPPEDWRPKQDPAVEQKRRAISPVELKYEPPPRKLKKRDNDAPARLLDDLFRKTKATPCIYWLPLTAAQIAVKEEIRRQHMADHERKLAELRKSDHARRDKDREKSRDRRKK